MLSFPPMQDDTTTKTTPQFDTAEYAGMPETPQCKVCNQSLGTGYYRANGNAVCATCAHNIQNQAPQDDHGAFARALLFGIGAAILGLIIYAAFGILTGWVIGYLSLAVGYIIAKAMMKGSNGVGGRRYQITAVLLTYAAVSMAAVPIAIGQYSKQAKSQQAQPTSGQSSSQQAQETPQTSKPSVGGTLVKLALFGLASPFLELEDPLHGVIGLVILFVGMQIAWKATAGAPAMELSGPF